MRIDTIPEKAVTRAYEDYLELRKTFKQDFYKLSLNEFVESSNELGLEYDMMGRRTN
jgi:hypothetical protein